MQLILLGALTIVQSSTVVKLNKLEERSWREAFETGAIQE